MLHSFHISRLRSVLRLALLGLVVFSCAGSLWAFPATIEVVSKVPVGQQPKLVVSVNDRAEKAVIQLTREDGRSFTFTLGTLAIGQTKELSLDGRVGRHEYRGEMSAEVDGERVSSPLEFETVVKSPLELRIDRDQLDLEGRQLVFSASAKVAQAQLTFFDPAGNAIKTEDYALSSAANQPVTLRWSGTSPEDIVRIELRVTDEDGFFKGVALTPWSVSIPHEEVLFDTNSAAIDVAEEGKLEASLEEVEKTLQRFEQVRGVQLFIAGHTDTVGKPAHNLNLSRRRAQAIGKWFVSRGIPIPVYFEGFGEASPKIKTGDEVDEPQNRRVDYILSVEPPTLESRAHGWKRLK